MRALIYEPSHSGHRLHYVSVLASALRELDVDITIVLTNTALGTDEFKVHLAPMAAWMDIETVHPLAAANSFRLQYDRYMQLIGVVKRYTPDHVYIPYADGLTQIAGLVEMLRVHWPRGLECEALRMRGGFEYGILKGTKSNIKNGLAESAPWTVHHYIDPLAFANMRKRGGRLATRSRLIPEPIERMPRRTKHEARNALGIPQDGQYLGCVGRLDKRKGIDLLIRAFKQANMPRGARLLLMGRASEAIKRLKNEMANVLIKNDQLILIDRHISNEELSNGILAMDVVCVPYPRHIGSSGVLLRAIAANRPVLSSNFGWVHFVTQKFGLGWVCNVTSLEELSGMLKSSLKHSDSFVLNEAARRFLKFHSVRNHQEHWVTRIQERLGAKPAHVKLTWDWVLEADQ